MNNFLLYIQKYIIEERRKTFKLLAKNEIKYEAEKKKCKLGWLAQLSDSSSGVKWQKIKNFFFVFKGEKM